MPLSEAIAKQGNKGKSYTTYHKNLPHDRVGSTTKSAQPPQQPYAPPTGRTQVHFMIHGPSLYNNLYKIPSYLSHYTERNPTSLTRFRSQSHQFIPTHKFFIENAQWVTYIQLLRPYCDQQVTGTEINILLQCPSNKHIANDLISTLSKLLELSHQPHGILSHCTNKRPSYLQTHLQHSPKNSTSHGSMLPYVTFSPT